MSIPILLLSDSPDSHSGLGRITRDIAIHISQMPEFRVGVMGRGGRGSSRLPFPQYVLNGEDNWGELRFEECWRDFARNEKGVVLSVWDASRVRWLVAPSQLPPALVTLLKSGQFQRWGYFPLDATGPNNRLTQINADTIKRFDRVLAYGMWGQDVIRKSTGRAEVDWLPHGVNFNAFQPRSPNEGKEFQESLEKWSDNELVGMVATNQTRKDWGLAFCVFDQLRRQRPGIQFWVHIDSMLRHWNIHSLIRDYGLTDCVQVTQEGLFSDTGLSHFYSACNLTILPSSEGFGYPIVESLACGTPVIHSNYAGGAELVPNKDWLVEPVTYRLEGIYNNLRPVWAPEDWVEAITRCLENPWDAQECRRSVSHLDWMNLKGPWEKWLLKGVGLGPRLETPKEKVG